MKKNIHQSILFALTLTSLLLTPALLRGYPPTNIQAGADIRTVPGQAPTTALAPATTTVLSNNPNSTDWSIYSPNWSLQNGFLDGSASEYPSPQIISTATFSSNRTVELDFKTVTAGVQPWYVAWMHGKYADFYHKTTLLLAANGALQYTVRYGDTVNYYLVNTTLSFTQWHHVKMGFSGNTSRVYVNGTLYFNVTDPMIGELGDSAVSLASWGNSESQFNRVTITGSVLADEPPIANFNVTPQPAAPGQQVSFDATSSTDPDGYVTNYRWNFGDGTTGNSPYPTHVYNLRGNYTVQLTVTDTSGQNATASRQIAIIPPTLTATPSSGPIGTTVKLHGSGFQLQTGPFPNPVSIDVTFDDQFIGVETITSASFDFTFNVPLSQAGLHQIHVYEQVYPSTVEATANFTVTEQPRAGLSLTVTTASLYFPGDTAAVYVLSTLNGSPIQAQTIHLKMLLPNGTSSDLSLVSISLGFYRATFAIPSKASVGTYALLAIAQVNHTNATAIASFEVKPTWLQANGHTIVTATTIAGAIGTFSILGVAWRKGYLGRKRESFPVS